MTAAEDHSSSQDHAPGAGDAGSKRPPRAEPSPWNPRPHPQLSNFGRRAYFAGYSDGFHGYHFGAGDEGAFGAFSDYRPGYADGASDGAPAVDPRDPHPTRTGIFRDHNCWKCRNGELPCVSRDSVCEYPHARND